LSRALDTFRKLQLHILTNIEITQDYERLFNSIFM
jgi:hypothetical protein